jgi:predicted 3-demethylubiquinone-9 3-methyltransferase (glyoxalase superfamily)
MSGTKIATCLWSHDNTGAEQVQFYANVFGENCKVTNPTGVMVSFELFNQSYQILNGGPHHRLSECVSISVTVDEQAEVDRLWTALCEGGGKPLECGWVKDRFDLCWQIVPSALPRLMKKGGAVAEAVFKVMLTMTKFDIATFEAAAAAAEKAGSESSTAAAAAESTDKKRSSPEDAEAQASKK